MHPDPTLTGKKDLRPMNTAIADGFGISSAPSHDTASPLTLRDDHAVARRHDRPPMTAVRTTGAR